MGIWAGTLSSLVDGTTSSYFILESPKSRFESKILKKLEGLFSAIKYPVRGMVFCVFVQLLILKLSIISGDLHFTQSPVQNKQEQSHIASRAEKSRK